MQAYQHSSAFRCVDRWLRSPLAGAWRDLPLPKSLKGAILASKLPGIWRMSA